MTEERLRMKQEQEQAIILDSSDSEQNMKSKKWPDLTAWQPVSSLVYVVFSDFLLSQLSHLNFTIEFSAWSLLCSEFIQHWLSLRWKEAKWDKWDRSDYSCQMSLIVFLALVHY